MPESPASTGGNQQLVHRLRALVVQLDLFGAKFAQAHDLHATDVRALICLLDAARADHNATPGWLGQQLGLESASVTALVDRMANKRLVSRDRDPRDRRRVLIDVTDHAKELGWTFFGPLIAHADSAIDGFTREQIRTIDLFLSRMIAAVEEA